MPLILVLVLALFVSTRALAEFDVTELLGQEDGGPIVSDFTRQMGCVRRGDKLQYIKCMNTGVELKTDFNVIAAWLYAQGVDGYEAFQGQIPLGLAWGMTPQQVEARLGPPQRVLGGSVAQYRFTNLPFNVELTYYTDNPRLGRVLFTDKRYYGN